MISLERASKGCKAAIGRVDPGLLLALLLALVAAWPFITRPGLPRGTDAELHVFRAAELGHALRWDNPYPRWAPHFYYGYGYPIFNYYAPLTYYLANLFALWPGVSIVAGVKLVFILGLVLAAVGAYLFVRDWLGPRSGLLASALYVFSPYVLLVDPHMRGVLAESFSLGLFPLLLWMFYRLSEDGRRRWLVGGAVLQAAVIMSHNLMAAVFTSFLLLFLGWELGGRLLRSARGRGWRVALRANQTAVARTLTAFALGVALSGIFWVPVALERNQVHLTLTGPGHFDFHNHFLSLGGLLEPSPILDLGAVAPRFALNLGLPQWPLAVLGLLAVFLVSPHRRRLGIFFVLGALGFVFLMLPISTPVWESVPGLELLQFPWRLLGPTALTLSVTGAAGYALLERRNLSDRWRAVILALGIGLVLFLALPAMFPPLWSPDFGPTDPNGIIDFELTGVAVGTTSTGDFIPATVEILPHPEPAYLATFRSPNGPDRVNRATLPEGTQVEEISRGPTFNRYGVQSANSFILRLFTFDFPGWRATIDGRPVPIELGRPEGFITVPVPAGSHTVEVRFVLLATPARAAGTLLTLGGLLVLILFGFRATYTTLRPQGVSCSASAAPDYPARARMGTAAGLAVGGTLLAFVFFKVGLVDRQHNWFRRTSPPGVVLGLDHSLLEKPVIFGHHIQLLGYDLPQGEVRAGESLPLTLYWRAIASVPDNFQVFAHLTRPIAHLWGQSDNLNPGEIPTTRWPLDKHVRDEHQIRVLPGTPPGDYRLTVGLYTLADGVRVPVFDADGSFLGDTFTLPTPVQVRKPAHPPARAALGLTDEIGVTFAGQVTLLGAVVPDRHIELPGFVHLALLWRAEVDGPEDRSVWVQMRDTVGSVVRESVASPVDGDYPFPLWSAGEIVRDQYSFWLDESFVPGTYNLRVRCGQAGAWVPLGRVEVSGDQ